MSERELNRAVAGITGETVETIQRLGFRLDAAADDGSTFEEDALGGPQVLDWDSGREARLADVLGDDDWPGRIEPLPSYDEELDEADEFAETVCAAA